MMTDFFAFGSLLVARLQEQIPALPIVLTINLPELDDLEVKNTTLFVAIESSEPEKSIDHGKSFRVTQHWSVLVASRDSASMGVIIAQVIRAVAGWPVQGSTDFKSCQMISSMMPGKKTGWTPGGVHYFPVVFSTTFFFNV